MAERAKRKTKTKTKKKNEDERRVLGGAGGGAAELHDEAAVVEGHAPHGLPVGLGVGEGHALAPLRSRHHRVALHLHPIDPLHARYKNVENMNYYFYKIIQ
jgi:hypothetical protein